MKPTCSAWSDQMYVKYAKGFMDRSSSLTSKTGQVERLKEGLTVLIAGPPNAGKSTLLNAIARRDVAIVSEYAGTTRDIIEVRLDLGGYPVNLIDTAGIRDSDNPVEQEGIDRALRRSATADLILWLTPIGDCDCARPTEFAQKRLWRVITKVDDAQPVLRLSNSTVGASELEACSELQISAKTGLNFERLINRLQLLASSEMSIDGSLIVANQRQREALGLAQDALAAALEEHVPSEILAEELRRACFALENLIGKIGVEDVLDQIFAQFCVGK